MHMSGRVYQQLHWAAGAAPRRGVRAQRAGGAMNCMWRQFIYVVSLISYVRYRKSRDAVSGRLEALETGGRVPSFFEYPPSLGGEEGGT